MFYRPMGDSHRVQVLRAMSAPTPSASTLDRFLFSIARMSHVQWLPDYQPNEKFVNNQTFDHSDNSYHSLQGGCDFFHAGILFNSRNRHNSTP